MPSDLRPFRLNLEQLMEVRDTFTSRLRDGLAAKRNDKQIKCLPAYLPKPKQAPIGKAVVIDLGGTNLRAALVEVRKGRSSLIGNAVEDGALMVKAKEKNAVDAERFYRRQAEFAIQVAGGERRAIGYCFSYPASIKADGSATLIKWTKGVQIDGIEGENVANQLREVIEAKGQPVSRIFTLNDTVATLLAAVVAAPDRDRYVGLIAGTGTNTAGFFPREMLDGFEGDWPHAEMAINLESGNFHPPHLTKIDDDFDAGLTDGSTGRQRFEKAMAGSYLPFLFARIMGETTTIDPTDADAGADLSNLRDRPDRAGKTARVLIDRSADLIAAKIAGLVSIYDEPGRVAVLGEGSFLTKTSGYVDRVRSRLDELAPESAQVEMLTLADCETEMPSANYVGAACAALMEGKGGGRS